MSSGATAKDLDDRFPATAPAAAVQPAKNAGGLIVSAANVTVDKGNTLDRLLAAQGVPADNRHAVLTALGDMIDPASLPAGSRLRLTFAPADDAAAGSTTRLVQTVELMTGDTTSLMVHIDAARPVSDQDVAKALQARSGSSSGKASIWTANQKPADQQSDGQQAAAGSTADRSQAASRDTQADSGPADSAQGDGQFIVQHVTGTVGKNLRAALITKGLPAAVADEIVLGFKAGPGRLPALHAAATFEVIYEGLQRGSKLDEPQLRYAMLDDGGKTQRIYRYQTDEQTTTLMQEDGHGVALVDLGKPLQIDARITSPYGWRIHPVFGDRRFHEGVDFGAPTGTPVVATSDGVVEDIGWRGNY
ncbi:MAG TPA: M23 family metallopeptidase, partial [Terriglobales bacterium]|nr:M23 family metallopeptidase [Terriglobales bacterium]